MDRCTGEVKVVTANFVNGSATVAFYNRVRTFTYQDFQSGVLQAWLIETYSWWNTLSPCSTTTQQTQTAQQQAQQAQQQAQQAQQASTAASNAAQSATTATTSVPTPPTTSSTTPPPATTGTTQNTTTNTGSTNTNTGSTNTGSTNTSSNNTSGGTTNDTTNNTGGTTNDGGTTNTDSSSSSGGTETGSTSEGSTSDTSSNEGGDTSSEGSTETTSDSSGTEEGSSTEGGSEEGGEVESTEESTETESTEESTEETSSEESSEESTEESSEESSEEESSEEESSEESEESEEESEESEEESEESEEESDEEKSSEEEKEEEEEQKKFMPIQLKADMMSMQTPIGPYNQVLNIGASRSSIYGDVAYTANVMVWDNLQQVSFMGAISKVNMTEDYQVKNISATSAGYSNNYGYSTLMLSQSFMKPFKNGLTMGMGISAGSSFVSYPIKENFMLSYNVLATKSFQLGERITYSPALIWTQTPFMSGESGVNFKWENPMGLQMRNLLKGREIDGMAILANSFTVQLTKRFSFNIGWTVIKSTNPIVPIINSFMIGTKLPF